MIFETQEQLDAALAKWQPICGLRDWKIKAELVPARNCPSTDGISRSLWKYKVSHIQVVEGTGRGEWCDLDTDHEQILVHELAHCMLGPVNTYADGGDLHDQVLEQAVETIANALLRVDRSTQ